MTKKIVIKMRNLKKMIGNDLLQLALILSLLKVDPDAYFGFHPYSSWDPGQDVMLGQSWAQTQSQLPDSWLGGLGPSPHLHPKSMESLLESVQADILDDLNNLGRYSRISAYEGRPVHISAYILDTNHGQQCEDDVTEDNDNDSGISDTDLPEAGEISDHDTDSEKEKEKEEKNPGEDSVDDEVTNLMDFDMGNDPVDVFGLNTIMGLTPPPEEELKDLSDSGDLLDFAAGTDALEAELVHIDEQLMNIDDDLGHINEAFMSLDEQLAVHISQDDDMMIDDLELDGHMVVVGDDYAEENAGFLSVDEQLAAHISQEDDGFSDDVVTTVDDDLHEFESILQNQMNTNPFDDWEKDAHSNFEELFNDDVIDITNSNEALDNIKISSVGNPDENNNQTDESRGEVSEPSNFLNDPDLFPTDHSVPPSAILEDFDEDLLEEGASKQVMPVDKLIRNDVHLPQVSAEQTVTANSSQPFSPFQSNEEFEYDNLEVVQANATTIEDNVFQPEDADLLQEFDTVHESAIDETDEDIIMKVLRESGVDLHNLNTIAEEDEEINVVDPPLYELGGAVDGAGAKAGITDFNNLHENIKAEFKEEQDDGTAVAEFSLSPHLSLTYQPPFNERAYLNDHSGYAAAEEDKVEKSESSSGSGRKRDISESSGYSSQGQSNDQDDARMSRDVRLAKKMGLPFDVNEIVNLPVEQFTDLVAQYKLTEKQLQLCRDIRRRGKNKVAAQNCRRRKMDQIEALQTQVESARRRKERLLREREQLEQERSRWSSKLLHLEQNVLKGMGRNMGQFRLEVSSGRVVVTASLTGHAAALVDTGSSHRTRGRKSRD